MKDYDYHSLFYYQILARIKGLKAGDGEQIHYRNPPEEDSPRFDTGFEPRDESYRHNYLRDKHISTRNILVTGKNHERANDTVIIASVKRTGESMTLYKRAIEFVFKDKHEEAMKELVGLMSKFYEVRIEDVSNHSQVDYSQSRYSDQRYMYDPR